MSSAEPSKNDVGEFSCTFNEASLGIGFIEVEAPGQQGWYYVVVDEIRPNSDASKYNRLARGSVLIEIGEEKVNFKPLDEIVTIIKGSPRPLVLTFDTKMPSPPTKTLVHCKFEQEQLGIHLTNIEDESTGKDIVIYNT